MAAKTRAGACVALALLAALAPVAAAQDAACVPPGMNGQCNELGTIMMEFQRDVEGQPIDVSAHVTINTLYRDREARAFLFSIRNASTSDASPITLQLLAFSSSGADIAVTKREDVGENEINLWVDILDVPVGQPIDLVVRAGSTDRGAFRLEALVMPFDRGYHPIRASDGTEASLFAFTLLAVNEETGSMGGGGIFGTGSVGKRLPGMDAGLAAAAVVVAGLALAGAPPRRPGRTLLRVFRRP